MAKKKKNFDEFPWFRLIFKPDGYVVEMNKFEKLTPALIAKGMRQVSRQRRILIKQLMREERQNVGRREEKERGRSGSESPAGSVKGDAGADESVDGLIDSLIGKPEGVHAGADNDEGVDRGTKEGTRRQKAKAN
jgi:hypothetical protein